MHYYINNNNPRPLKGVKQCGNIDRTAIAHLHYQAICNTGSAAQRTRHKLIRENGRVQQLVNMFAMYYEAPPLPSLAVDSSQQHTLHALKHTHTL